MKFKCTVIGAGVVGLAVAKTLSQYLTSDDGVLVLEKEKTFGTGISSRNSEVIHAGIYYPTQSLKHRLCIQGRKLLYAYSQKYGLPYRKCGKLIVATSDKEVEELDRIYQHARANQVENVVRLTRAEALRLEPDIKVEAALFSQETGIIDTHSYMEKMEQDIHSNNGTVVYGTRVQAIAYNGKSYQLQTHSDVCIESEWLINAAGLQAIELSKGLGITKETLYPCKGSYFYYDGPHRFTHLVYPIPEKKLTGLGVHVTLDLAGRLKFGPDTEYVDSVDDFQVDERKRAAFYASAQKLIKNIELDKFMPDMAAIRPKLQGPKDDAVKDFYIQAEPGYPGFINLLGIESPGLTSSLAIGAYVAERLLQIN